MLAATVFVPEEAGAASRMVDPIAGFTFTVGAASLYAPDQPLRIRTGDSMVWTNLDPIPHDVTFEGIPFAVYLKTGESAELTFTQPGRFLFQCLNHTELPSMHGLVYVE